jgi:mannose-6-phosphate isomerase-like protein (cupin superfamily)
VTLTTASTYGVITNTVDGPATCRNLMGGEGDTWWKQLAYGPHLGPEWNTVEHVVLRKGVSCGEHDHRDTEEIYAILTGTAVMLIDGRAVTVTAGDLVTAPIGTRHGIVGTSDEPMAFLVTEVYPRAAAAPTGVRLHVRKAMKPRAGYRESAGDILAAEVDLAPLFTGPWSHFSEIAIEPGTTFTPAPSPGLTEVVFAAAGHGRIDAAGAVMTGSGWCAGIPPGTPWSVRNAVNADEPARIITVGVHAHADRP